MADVSTGTGQRCSSTAPDQWTISCELGAGHDGKHRNNMVTWEQPQRILVGGVEPDLTRESEAWVGGQVLLEGDRR